MTGAVAIVGGGGHARVVVDLLERLGIACAGVYDPGLAPGAAGPGGVPVLGDDDALAARAGDGVRLANGIGSTRAPARGAAVFARLAGLGFEFPPLVHPGATVAPSVRIGAGGQVMAGAVVQAGTTLAENCLLNTGASVDHDCRIGPSVHVGPGATLCGAVVVGAESHVGVGATVIQGVRIGARATVGAGVIVLADVPDECFVDPRSQRVWTGG